MWLHASDNLNEQLGNTDNISAAKPYIFLVWSSYYYPEGTWKIFTSICSHANLPNILIKPIYHNNYFS